MYVPRYIPSATGSTVLVPSPQPQLAVYVSAPGSENELVAVIDVAINTGNYETQIGDAAPIRLRYSFVYHKVGDQWLIVDHHSSRLPE